MSNQDDYGENNREYDPELAFAINDPKEAERKRVEQEEERRKKYETLTIELQTRQTNAQELQARSNTAITFLTAALIVISIAGAFVNWLQFQTAKDSTKAALAATYLSCLSAQTAQATLIEMRNEGDYSYAMARAAATQNAGEIDSERAFVRIFATTPRQDQIQAGNFIIPIDIRNEGKGTAVKFSGNYRAVFLNNGEQLRFDSKNMSSVGSLFLRQEISPAPTDGYNLARLNIKVRNPTGVAIDISPAVIKDFFATSSATIYFYGNLTYTDVFGSYSAEFCQPMFVMQPGTSRPVLDNDKKCGLYNKQSSYYVTAPLPAPLPSTQLKDFRQITCTPPTQQ
jgi:hypothetical protein